MTAPPDPGSLAACMARLTGCDASEVPTQDAAAGVEGLRGWLAGRNLGLVPVRDPERFSWAGAFLALGADGRAALMFGVPPGVLFDPAGAGPRAVRECWVLAPLDHELPSGASPYGSAVEAGTLEAIVVAPLAEAAAELLGRATVTPRGLKGDRYFAGAGTFSNGPGGGRALTLVEAEVLDELGLDPRAARRNLVTRGIALNPLVGRRFAVGDVECFGSRLCEPCAHLDRLAGRGLLRRLVRRGGLRADVLGEGLVEPGDPIRAL